VGALRHRVTVEEPERAADDGGGGDVTWATVANVWAEVVPKSGREVFESDQLGGRITHEVRMRWRADIAPDMRIIHRGRPFNVRYAVNVSGRDEWLICECEEASL